MAVFAICNKKVIINVLREHGRFVALFGRFSRKNENKFVPEKQHINYNGSSILVSIIKYESEVVIQK